MNKDACFKKILEALYQELLKANMHFKIFWALRTAPNDIANIRKVYLTFFIFTMRSHNEIFCIAVHNAVKPRRDTANFAKLFNYIRYNKNLQNIFDLKEIEGMEATIKSHASLIKRIAIIRNQYVAHNQLTNKHLAEETTYKYEEGKRLILDLNNILEKISGKYDKTLHWEENGLFNVSPSLNVEDMLRHLTEYRSEQPKKRRQGVIS